MTHQSLTMKVMAEKYEQLARSTSDPADRQRFGEYVKLYREMEGHFAEAERSTDATDREH
jgi:hypothetical protein